MERGGKNVDRAQLRKLLVAIKGITKGFPTDLVLCAYENAAANLILEIATGEAEAKELAICVGVDVAAMIDRYFKNLAPKP